MAAVAIAECSLVAVMGKVYISRVSAEKNDVFCTARLGGHGQYRRNEQPGDNEEDNPVFLHEYARLSSRFIHRNDGFSVFGQPVKI